MTTKDLKSNVDAVQSLTPAVRTVAANGTGVDLRGYESAMVVFSLGAFTDGEFTPGVEESDSLGSGYTAVAAGDLAGTLTPIGSVAGQNAIQRVGYKGTKRFIRAVVAEEASPTPSTGLEIGANVLRNSAHGLPLS